MQSILCLLMLASAPEPFAFADFTWLNGNPRTKESPLDSKAFTGEFRADTPIWPRQKAASTWRSW